MGEVYRARDTRLHRDVAVKVIRDLAKSQRRLVRFEREARAVAALSHPNILAIYDIGTEQGIPFSVVELLQGRTLRERLHDGALSPDEAIDAARQIASGLVAAHDKGIIHRDLKPENIFITVNRQIKILDFGVAKVVGEDERLAEKREVRTRAGAMVGSIGYMAPEQLRGLEIDARADIFAFGTLLYEMLTGRPAFWKKTKEASLAAIVSEQPTPVQEIAASVSEGVIEILERCLHKDPSERYPSAREIEQDLDGLKDTHAARSTDASLAVLPFVDMSPKRDQEYLCDGIAEEILDTLSTLPELRVAARTSAFQFKGKNEDVREIGRRLRVATVLEGSVRLAGTRLRVTAKLADASNGYQMWSEKFDRELDDIFAIQDDIAHKIVECLEVKLVQPESTTVRRPNLDAYHEYLRARFQMNRRSRKGILLGIEHARKAIEIDPDYAQAHACIADGLFLLSFQGAEPPSEAMLEAKQAASRALECDAKLAEAHVSLATIQATYDRDWTASESSFRRGIELGPSSASAHYWFAIWFLTPLARFAEAEREVTLACELDPLSLFVNAGKGWQLFFARQHERALDEARKTLETDDDFPMAHDIAAQALRELGRHAEAIDAARRAVQLTDGRSLSLAILGHAYATAGDEPAAIETLGRLLAARKSHYASSYDIALVYVGLSQHDEALDWLERAVEERNGWSVFLNVDPRFDGLRADERYSSLTRRLGLTG